MQIYEYHLFSMYWLFIYLFLNSGGAIISVTGENKRICGKQTNRSFLIMEKTADIHAWGFSYHSHTEEFRENNGTKFLVDFIALPEESFLGI